MYVSALRLSHGIAESFKSPTRLTVPEAAEKHITLNTPGGYAGPWRNDVVPYMIEPAECLTGRKYSAVIFVGPAQSGKTASLLDNWLAHTILCDPSDIMVVQVSQDMGRDYSKRRIDRMIDANTTIRGKLRQSRQADNTFDKLFRSGMILSIGWPSKNVLAGKAIGKMALTDYDRMPDDIDCEGAAFALATKRTTTFLSRGMTMAESSPSKEILDAKWKAETPHEAPPTKGILGLFNTGDRRRFYWQCQHCAEYFMQPPGIAGFVWPTSEKDPQTASEQAGVPCPSCGSIHDHSHKQAMLASHRWLKDGQTVNKNGEVHGVGRKSSRASFWLPGAAAAFQTWQSLVLNYLLAVEVFDRSGEEEPLKNTTNLDQGAPYLYKSQQNERDPHALENRAETVEKRTVPDGVRFLTAAVDVQKTRFVVQVHGWGVDLECWLIDRYNLRFATRQDDEGKAETIDPAGHFEDWEILIEKVINRSYPLADGSGRELPIMMTACDSGGLAGVTENAYQFWRKVKRQRFAKKFMLVKGAPRKGAATISISYPDNTKRKDRKATAAGSIPVYLLNTDVLKDTIDSFLHRDEPGGGFMHFPAWLGSWFYAELTAETRTDKGWVNPRKDRNEAFDLMVYNYVAAKEKKADKINWDNPPVWAREPENNPYLISQQQEEKPVATKEQIKRPPRFRFNRNH